MEYYYNMYNYNYPAGYGTDCGNGDPYQGADNSTSNVERVVTMKMKNNINNKNKKKICSNHNYNSNKIDITNNNKKKNNNNIDINKEKKKKMIQLSTDPQSVAARERRHKISEKLKTLESLLPRSETGSGSGSGSINYKLDTVSMLDQAIHYVNFLKDQISLHQNLSNMFDGLFFNDNNNYQQVLQDDYTTYHPNDNDNNNNIITINNRYINININHPHHDHYPSTSTADSSTSTEIWPSSTSFTSDHYCTNYYI